MGGLHLDRRRLLLAAAACGLGASAAACSGERPAARSPSAGSGPGSGPAPGPAVELPAGLLLARRLTAAPTPELVGLAAGGATAFCDGQLAPGDESAEVATLLAALDATAPATGGRLDGAARRAGLAVAASRSLVTAAWSHRQVHHAVAEVLLDHLHVTVAESPEVVLVAAHDRVVRAGALGRYADLLVAATRTPAMLVFLDNARSRADGGATPNENHARELLELHTVGAGGGYDEADVVEVSHVLSGWSIGPGRDAFTFRERRHDLGPLRAGGDVLGWRPGGAGVRDGEDLLGHLARLPATARFVSWKLARRFVDDDIGPDDPTVAELARTYLDADTELAPVVRHLAAMVAGEAPTPGAPVAPALLRRPADAVAAALGLGEDVATPARWRTLVRPVLRLLAGLGDVPRAWPGPDGPPSVAAAWSGAGALIARWNAATTLADLLPPGPGAAADPIDAARRLLGTDPGPALAAALAGADPVRARALVLASPGWSRR